MQTSSSCQAPNDTAVSADQAQGIIRATVRAVEETETIALQQALGRVLAADLIAPMDVPPHRNSAMDGYAVRGAELGGAATCSFGSAVRPSPDTHSTAMCRPAAACAS
jgi:molybdopterin molybdotransferase